jgi:hypothetical protein
MSKRCVKPYGVKWTYRQSSSSLRGSSSTPYALMAQEPRRQGIGRSTPSSSVQFYIRMSPRHTNASEPTLYSLILNQLMNGNTLPVRPIMRHMLKYTPCAHSCPGA